MFLVIKRWIDDRLKLLAILLTGCTDTEIEYL